MVLGGKSGPAVAAGSSGALTTELMGAAMMCQTGRESHHCRQRDCYYYQVVKIVSDGTDELVTG